LPIKLSRIGLNPVSDLRYYRSLWHIFQRQQPDVVLAYTHKPVVYSALAAKSFQSVRVYGLVTGLGYAFADTSLISLKQIVSRAMLCWLYRSAKSRWNGLMFQNGDDQALFRQHKLTTDGVPQIVVRGSGVDLKNFALEKPGSETGHFLMIARLLADKGIREFVAAARIVRALHPQSTFSVVGAYDPNPTGIKPAEITQWVTEGIIKYQGTTNDVRPYLKKCSVFVLPSYREGTPRSVLEAMAVGRPIITTDAPGCRETVFGATSPDSALVRQGHNGLIVPVRNPQALAQAMLYLVKNPVLSDQMGIKSRLLAEEYYDVHHVNQQMLAFMNL
jgi:glycosyltransferase involved in cell wall biosynthesis